MWTNVSGYRNSLSGQILSVVLTISSCVTLFITGFQILSEYRADSNYLDKSIGVANVGYSRGLSHSLWEMNLPEVKSQLDGIVTIPGIIHAQVREGSKVLAEAGHLSGRQLLTKTFELRNEKEVLGTLVIDGDMGGVIAKVYDKAIFIFFVQFLKTLIVSILIYFAIQRLLTRHLMRIAQSIKSPGDPSQVPTQLVLSRNRKNDELELMVTALNQMRMGLFRSFQELNTLNRTLEQKVEDKTKEILDQRQQLEFSSKMSALGEMTGGIAHEINTPLATICLSAEMIHEIVSEENFDPTLLYNPMQSITACANRISRIIKSMRMVTRSSGHEPLIDSDPKELWENAIDLCHYRFKASGIDLRLDPPPRGLLLNCDRVQIVQVFLNLLNNAYDAVEKQTEKWVHVSWECNEKWVQILITDSGPLISPDIREKIMLPFFTTKDIGKGTGLGLSVSNSIIERHGGKLSLDANSPHTCFRIALPRAQLAKVVA